MLRWVFRGVVLIVAAVGLALAACELLLPKDATGNILELRGQFGGAAELASRRDARSSVRWIALRNDRGQTLTTAWVRRPRALRPDYRILLTYAGEDTGETMLRLIPATDDLVLVAVQYPWHPPRTIAGKLTAIYDIRQAAYRTIAGGMLAIDELERDEHLDPHRILLLGASLGSIFATIHGAIDTRVPLVVLVHGGASLEDTLAAEVRHVPEEVQRTVARIGRIPIDTFDPARYVARIAPRRLLMIEGRDDWRFPPQATTAFFDLARQPKELRWTDTGHVGKRSQRVVDEVIAVLNAYLENR